MKLSNNKKSPSSTSNRASPERVSVWKRALCDITPQSCRRSSLSGSPTLRSRVGFQPPKVSRPPYFCLPPHVEGPTKPQLCHKPNWRNKNSVTSLKSHQKAGFTQQVPMPSYTLHFYPSLYASPTPLQVKQVPPTAKKLSAKKLNSHESLSFLFKHTSCIEQ